MEGELWMELYRRIMESGKFGRGRWQQFSDARIALVYFWAVLHDRPVCWACDERNWPDDQPGGPLPSNATMSRRLRTEGVQAVLDWLEMAHRQRLGGGLFKCIDAMPLLIGNSSGDRQAGYGRAARGKGKGYKFYAIYDPNGVVDAWRVCPMNVSEKKMGRRLVGRLSGTGYLIGDGEYDDSKLYALAALQQWQLVAPKRKGAGLGHRRQRPERLRGIALQQTAFGQGLLRSRAGIERFFGAWSSAGGGLTRPPAWIRTLPRVRRWVQAKLIIQYTRTSQKQQLTA